MSQTSPEQNPARIRASASDAPGWSPDDPGVVDLLQEAEILDCALLPWGSNYTFLVTLDGGAAGMGQAVYKPRRGEAPLYDFPDGTLYLRERAAYLVSEALGWGFIPPTIVRREAPQGVGSLQLFIPSDDRASYFTFREERLDALQRIAAFDCLANNADRKGGHCLLGPDGRIWGIDHGLTFHVVPKLRTVIWEFQGQAIPEHLLKDMGKLLTQLEKRDELTDALRELLTAAEIAALCERLQRLLSVRRYPEPGLRRSVPWPPV